MKQTKINVCQICGISEVIALNEFDNEDTKIWCSDCDDYVSENCVEAITEAELKERRYELSINE
jgi:hypothetical protein